MRTTASPLKHLVLSVLLMLAAHVSPGSSSSSSTTGCTPATALVRKEYGRLSTAEQLGFVGAVRCVMARPSRLRHAGVPAAASKFDDFVAVHINLTTAVHLNGVFLAWHRHFVWLMERELHACGFPAHLGMPYWDWTLWPELEASPMFDGSNTSLGSNGAYDPVPNGTYTAAGGTVVLRGGSGGGCVASGPFANRTVSFRPLDFAYVLQGGGPPANWTEPAPHCLTRDFNNGGVRAFNSAAEVAYLLSMTTVGAFNSVVNGYGDKPGLHGGGHYALGGTGYDFFGSPQDPAFYLHHTMIDRVWALWQDDDAAEPGARRYVYNGTSTIFNDDATPEVTNDTVLLYTSLGEPVTAGEVQDPMAGPYCYVYV